MQIEKRDTGRSIEIIGEKASFRNFLDMNTAADPPHTFSVKNTDGSPSTSNAGGSVAGSSVLGSERQISNHLEGIPFYSPRSTLPGPVVGNRFAGNKRCNSGSSPMEANRDGESHLGFDPPDSTHLMKMLKSRGGIDGHKRLGEEDVPRVTYPLGSNSASLMLQPSSGSTFDANISKWERSVSNGQLVPSMQQVLPNRLMDPGNGSSVAFHVASDEGSRTGMKGSSVPGGILSGCGVSDKRSLGHSLSCSSKHELDSSLLKLESLSSSGQQGLTSVGHQMTIFYGGQAHVFDDVHPNKADIIMALAGSNGCSWSTTYSSKPSTRTCGEHHTAVEDGVAGMVSRSEFSEKPSAVDNTGRAIYPSRTGGQHAGIMMYQETNKEPRREK